MLAILDEELCIQKIFLFFSHGGWWESNQLLGSTSPIQNPKDLLGDIQTVFFYAEVVVHASGHW